MKYLTIEDLKEIGQISRNCDIEKLNIAEMEAFNFDLTPLIDCYSIEISNNWQEKEGVWFNVINPNTFDNKDCKNCGYHKGLKSVLAYFTFARYMILNEFNDTPNGNVSKSNDFSFPTNYKALKDRADMYREMAKYTMEGVVNYMRVNRNDYPLFFPKNSVAKGYGVKIKNVW